MGERQTLAGSHCYYGRRSISRLPGLAASFAVLFELNQSTLNATFDPLHKPSIGRDLPSA
jgi:hypothetical protein